jgi:hypothetical protein
MGNSPTSPDPDYIIRGYQYWKAIEDETYGKVVLYKSLNSDEVKIVKHFPYFSKEKQNDPKIVKTEQLAN